MSPITKESIAELDKNAEENTCNAPQEPSPQSTEVQTTEAPSECREGKQGGKLRLILTPYHMLRQRYHTLMNKSDREDEDDTDQKPRGRVAGPVAGGPRTEPKLKPKPKPKPGSGRWVGIISR